MKKLVLFLTGVLFLGAVQGQELQAKLSVLSNRVSTQVDKKVFQTLEGALTTFLTTVNGQMKPISLRKRSNATFC